MFNWLKKFKKQSTVKIVDEKYLASFFVGILPDGNIEILNKWFEDTSIDLANIYGELLFRLTNGFYSESIREILSQYPNHHNESLDFIVAILTIWQLLEAEKTNMMDRPKIMPNAVFAQENGQ